MASWTQSGGLPVDLAAASSMEARFDAPDVSARTELQFTLTVRNSCGMTANDTVTIALLPDPTPNPETPSDETLPDDPAEPVPGVSSLTLRIEMTDDRGLPITGLAGPQVGDRIILRVTATNTGDSVLEGLNGSIRGCGSVAFEPLMLAPWQTGRADILLTLEADDMQEPWIVDAYAYDPSGQVVRATDRLAWWSDAVDTELVLEVVTNPASGAIDEVLTIIYRIVHAAGAPIDDLVLNDDRLGRIDLPWTRIEPGGVLTVEAIDRPSSEDLPGPVTRTVTVSGFTSDGRSVTAEAVLETVLDAAIAGGGGSTEAEARVVISEIAWAGNPDDPSAEWIELANAGAIPVDLEGWTLCWIDGDRAASPIDEWMRIELAGTIEPIPSEVQAVGVPVFEAASEGVWRVLDGPSAGSPRGTAPGYYILERGSDEAIANLPADIVYGRTDAGWELSDRGAVVLLLDRQGRIVDSANAAAGPWPAGLRRTGATMERIDISQGDSPDAWRTNPGLLAYGRSALGTRLWASAGHASGPDLEQLIQSARTVLPAPVLTATTRVPVALSATDPMPWLQLAVLPETGSDSAGGGGSAAPLPRLTTERDGTDMAVTLDPEQLPAGLCFVWITGEEGEVQLILVRTGP